MEYELISNLISSLGFPIVLVLAMGAFIYLIYRDWTAINKEREEKLYEELAANREVVNKSLETLAEYNNRLGVIETDVKEIKVIVQGDRTNDQD